MATNLSLGKIILDCFNDLNAHGAWVYNLPLTPQYDVYIGNKHRFEIYASCLENNVFMLNIDGIKFDSRDYNLASLNGMRNLWGAAKQKFENQRS